MCEVICPYKDKCSDYGKQCSGCKRNTGKRSYYDPDWNPWTPYPYYPYPYYHWYIGDPIYNIPNSGYGTWITCGNSQTNPENSYFIQS